MLRMVEVKTYHPTGNYFLRSYVLCYVNLDNIQLEKEIHYYMKKNHPNTRYRWFIKQ